MKISAEKKKAVELYILEKIKERIPSAAVHVSASLGIDQSTVYRYIKELERTGVIKKEGRGRYVLSEKRYEYTLSRTEGDFRSDTLAYDRCVYPHICCFPDNVKNIWAYVISEMMNNVIDHSDAENAFITVLQDQLDTTVILRDNGIGIFRKIAAFFELPDMDDAVAELFKGKLTTDAVHHSGEGIFFSSRMMDRFRIVSDGKVFTCNEWNEDMISDLALQDGTGTVVIMSLSDNSARKASEIFDMYADVDGGFTRTMIPIGQIFHSAPVSRSQAKRVCSRLDSFSEVTLDFAGVDWTGQGFIHELFCVFGKKHPETVLLPVNMSEPVEKMVRHVTGK